ncbi:MAG: hypothetical protein ACI9O6_000209 [Glaciecola sp.]|jgi:hypothetical protein
MRNKKVEFTYKFPFFCILLIGAFYLLWWFLGRGSEWAKLYNVLGLIIVLGSKPWSDLLQLILNEILKADYMVLRLSSYAIGFTINATILRFVYLRIYNLIGNKEKR